MVTEAVVESNQLSLGLIKGNQCLRQGAEDYYEGLRADGYDSYGRANFTLVPSRSNHV